MAPRRQNTAIGSAVGQGGWSASTALFENAGIYHIRHAGPAAPESIDQGARLNEAGAAERDDLDSEFMMNEWRRQRRATAGAACGWPSAPAPATRRLPVAFERS